MHVCMLGQAAAGARVCLIVCVWSRYSSRTKGAGRGFAKHPPLPPCEDALFGERSQGPRSVSAECTEQQMRRGKTVGFAFALALVFVE